MSSTSGYVWVVFLTVVWMVACQESPSAPVWSVNGLAEGGRTFQKLEPDTVHVVPLHCSGPTFLSATLEQVGRDLVLVLRGPEGTELARADGPAGPRAVEFLAVRTDSGGAHRLEVRSPSGQGGAYVLELSQFRRRQEGDEVRVAGWNELQNGHHAYLVDGMEEARTDFATAQKHFRHRPDPIGEAYALQHLGWMATDRGSPQAAIDWYEQALSRLSGLPAVGVRAGLLADRGSALKDLQQLTEARDSYRQALELWRLTGDDRNLTETLNSLGNVLIALGESDEARPLLAEVLQHRRAQGDRRGEATTWSVLGELHARSGEFSEALQAHQRALEIAQKEKLVELEFRSRVNLGGVLRDLAEPQSALRQFGEALDLEPSVDDRAVERLLMSHLGLAHVDIGDPDQAVPYFERALELAKTPHEIARTLLSWGWTEDDRGNPEAALELYGRALQLQPNAVPKEVWIHLQVGRARAFRALAQLGDARMAIERAGFEASASAPTSRIHYWLERGEIARLEERRKEARENLEQALESSRRLGLAGKEAVALLRLGRLARDEGRLAEARSLLEQALDLYESLRAQVTSSELRTSYLAQRLLGFEAYLDLLVELDRRQPEADWRGRAFAASERMRARTLDEILAVASQAAGAGPPPELLQRRRRAVENLQRVQRRLLEGGDDALRSELEHWQRELERSQWQIDDGWAAAGGGSSRAMTIDRLREVLPEDAVMLEYAPGIERTFVFVVTHDSVDLRILPPFPDIEGKTLDLVQALRSSNRRFRVKRRQLSKDLYDTLIAPVGELLHGSDHLFIAPMGALHYLPFEALWDGRSPLIRRWAVSYVPSAAVLEKLAHMKSKEGAKGFVAFADPELPRGSGTEPDPANRMLAPLPGAQDEVQAIARILPAGETRLFIGPDATESRVKEEPAVRLARWLHFASHGLLGQRHEVLGHRAEFSSLLLARTPESPEDGLLQAHEIRELELGADLVVLSACETGLGEVVRGEGLVGLSQAFLSAGARNLVVSLWRVEDRSTAALMTAFYHRLHQGKSPAQALRDAKLELLDRGSGSPWSEPYYWAPFVLIGGR